MLIKGCFDLIIWFIIDWLSSCWSGEIGFGFILCWDFKKLGWFRDGLG